MTVPAIRPSQRRHYSREFKQQLVDQCQPGISVSGIALSHGINANLLRRWIREFQGIQPSTPVKLVPLSVQHPALSSDSMIEIHVERKGTTVKLRWPSSATASLTVLLTNWLK